MLRRLGTRAQREPWLIDDQVVESEQAAWGVLPKSRSQYRCSHEIGDPPDAEEDIAMAVRASVSRIREWRSGRMRWWCL